MVKLRAISLNKMLQNNLLKKEKKAPFLRSHTHIHIVQGGGRIYESGIPDTQRKNISSTQSVLHHPTIDHPSSLHFDKRRGTILTQTNS